MIEVRLFKSSELRLLRLSASSSVSDVKPLNSKCFPLKLRNCSFVIEVSPFNSRFLTLLRLSACWSVIKVSPFN